MTDKELRKLRRVELLELLVDQAAEMEELRRQLDQANQALAERELHLKEAGSIAEAALRLNGVFEAAQAAAQQYLDNIRQRSEHIEEACARREALCVQREEESRRRCQAMEAEAREKAEAYWAEVSGRLKRFYQEHEALKELLNAGGGA